jgi:hypothetical protein
MAFASVVLAMGQASEGGIKPSVFSGEISAVAEHSISIKTKDGEMTVNFTDKTAFRRVSPENPSLQNAVAAAQTDLGVGDKVIVSGVPAADGRSVPARSVYLMTKADLAQKSAKDLEKWRTRGVSGKVVAVDAAAGTITVQPSGAAAGAPLTLAPKEKAKFLRYAPDSIRFDEAKPSSLAEIHAGDMIRAVGDRSMDGARFDAEEILTGAFQTVAGTVKSVDPARNEIVIKELRTNKDITVVVTDTSVVKRFPAEMAERMAGAQSAGGVRPPGGGNGQAGGPPAQGEGGQGPRRGPGRGNGIDDMLDRFPSITTADLTPGDMIALSSSKNGTPDRIKAIKLLAGVEPFLRTAQSAGAGRRPQGVDGGLNIPGLDGISFP